MSALPLLPDERVLVVGRPPLREVWPLYILTLGLYGFWHKRRVAALTSKRLLLGRGVFSRQEDFIPVRSVTDATYSRRGLAGFCEITSSSDWSHRRTRVGPLSPRTARRFALELQGRISTTS